jgi:hypothetical protein
MCIQNLKGFMYLAPACIKQESIQRSEIFLNLEEISQSAILLYYDIQGENAMTAVPNPPLLTPLLILYSKEKLFLRFSHNDRCYNMKYVLVVAGALWRIQVTKHIEFIQTCKSYKQEIPYHENETIFLIQLPAIEMCCHYQKQDSREQRQSGIRKTCNKQD